MKKIALNFKILLWHFMNLFYPPKQGNSYLNDCKHRWDFVPVVGNLHCDKCKAWRSLDMKDMEFYDKGFA